MHGKLDESGLFVGNTVVLREPLIVFRWGYGQSSLSSVWRWHATERVAKQSRQLLHFSTDRERHPADKEMNKDWKTEIIEFTDAEKHADSLRHKQENKDSYTETSRLRHKYIDRQTLFVYVCMSLFILSHYCWRSPLYIYIYNVTKYNPIVSSYNSKCLRTRGVIFIFLVYK